MGLGRTDKKGKESTMQSVTWKRKANVYGPDFYSIKDNHQVPQWDKMFAVTEGENSSRKNLSLAPMESCKHKCLSKWLDSSLFYICVAEIKSRFKELRK